MAYVKEFLRTIAYLCGFLIMGFIWEGLPDRQEKMERFLARWEAGSILDLRGEHEQHEKDRERFRARRENV